MSFLISSICSSRSVSSPASTRHLLICHQPASQCSTLHVAVGRSFKCSKNVLYISSACSKSFLQVESSFCSFNHLATKRSVVSSVSEWEMSESEICHFLSVRTEKGKK